MAVILCIIAMLLFLIFMSMGRRDTEEFFKKNDLPNGDKVNLYNWSSRAFGIAFIIVIIAYIFSRNVLISIGWAIIVLFLVVWVGPYLEYAMAWNRASKSGK